MPDLSQSLLSGGFMSTGGISVRVHAAEMLVYVLLAGKALAGVAFAVGMRADDCLLWAAVHPKHLPLVSQQPTGICEA
jgi:hypothetical protein